MLATVLSGAVVGVDSHLVRVEVSLYPGLPSFTIVGLPDASVRESKERVRSAIKESGFEFPIRRITVNLAPADLRKEGPAFDLPIALGILAASGQVSTDRLPRSVIAGELSLDGRVQPVRGVLPMACDLPRLCQAGGGGELALMVPRGNAREAAAARTGAVLPVGSLHEAHAHLEGSGAPLQAGGDRGSPPETADHATDFACVKSQRTARRALEIAAAGEHHALLVGPPGSGKTLMARAFPSILPALRHEESLEITRIYSVAGLLGPTGGLVSRRPFRAPHHTISDAALAGGGSEPRPGEVSLAHRGVLFLDEMLEFRRGTLEVLRQPLSEGRVHISRAAGAATFPCRFMLLGTTNPCPCGYLGDSSKGCSCTPLMIQRYRSRLSGPLMDRIDLHVEVPRLRTRDLLAAEAGAEASRAIRRRVIDARARQTRRYGGASEVSNGLAPIEQVREACDFDGKDLVYLRESAEALGLSARSVHSLIRMARTIADLDRSDRVGKPHIAEALQYRMAETV